MPPKTEAEVALEIYESVLQSNEKQKRLRSATFWRLFHVKARQKKVVDRITLLLHEQGLRASVKSGVSLGSEKDDDWIEIALTLPHPPPEPPPPIQWPSPTWFATMVSRTYESEREVETYFVTPALEKLGYQYDDIAMGHPVTMFRGVERMRTEADFVVFDGASRDPKDTLLVIEAKASTKGITVDHISQARSYAHELLAAYYVVTNGIQTKVFQFSGLLAPDECVMDFERGELRGRWRELYLLLSREAVLRRKTWLLSKLKE